MKRGYDRLTRDNILPAVQKARKDGELFDDGGGNVFEIEVEPTGEERKQLPKIPLSDTIIAIPLAMKEKFEALLLARQQLHQELLVKLETLPEVKWGTQV
ncbi:hypothetical protein FACS189428_5740 [Clostridia bacterium]|nr:hypothetical protein FACS189428_5740 [Clostridia bacterium]